MAHALLQESVHIRTAAALDLPPNWQPLAAGLRADAPGFWTAASAPAVSYPAAAHQAYLDIEAGSYWFRHRNRCIVTAVQRYPVDGWLADVGGGNGFVALALQQAGVRVALVEPGEFGARAAWQRGVRPVICATLAQAGFAPGSLGGVGVFDVLEHIADDAAFLAQVRGYLRPGGRLYVTVPAHRGLWSAEDVAAGHYRRYSRAGLRRTLGAAGFSLDLLTAFFAWLPLPIALWRSLPARLGLRPAARPLAGDHTLPRGLVGGALQALLAAEHAALQRGRQLMFGGSLLAVAHSTP